jgi:hypothetical protein
MGAARSNRTSPRRPPFRRNSSSVALAPAVRATRVPRVSGETGGISREAGLPAEPWNPSRSSRRAQRESLRARCGRPPDRPSPNRSERPPNHGDSDRHQAATLASDERRRWARRETRGLAAAAPIATSCATSVHPAHRGPELADYAHLLAGGTPLAGRSLRLRTRIAVRPCSMRGRSGLCVRGPITRHSRRGLYGYHPIRRTWLLGVRAIIDAGHADRRGQS